MQLSAINVLSFLATIVEAHGRVIQTTTSTGTIYPGWDPASSSNLTPPYPLVAWSASNLGNIYIPPSQFNTSNISCHYNALPGTLHIPITAGEELKLQWNEWPTSHVGPVTTYLAECQGSCAGVNKEDLQWVKIDELGWLNSTGWDEIDLGGTWAANMLIANGFSWVVRIPEVLAEGNYVLRHEIIALHVAEKGDGAQAYPQCVNLRVVAKGARRERKKLDGGVLGRELYGMMDEGILVDIHGKIAL
ncbi:lytic cellulose monooxygenase (C1-hydroxylating) [Alternaria panax]|uniref:Lytic cellulose monooxygenase (C1-hydroxylating) n=1 Tax=Alternaria panax TaxID=48097 RepID=A0AAD4I7A4_9PLEO|nr:lytic cellulose monooxygenase (C1-hydroxylating) [Alternaria panax]